MFLPHRLQLLAELVYIFLALLDPRLAGTDLPRAAIAAILEIGQLLVNTVQGSQDIEADCGCCHGTFAKWGTETKRAAVKSTTARGMCREKSDRSDRSDRSLN